MGFTVKPITLLSIILLASFSANAVKLPPKEAMVSASLKDYEKLLTSFFINKHCNFIDEAKSQKFEHDMATIASQLRQEAGDSKMLTYKLSEARNKAQEQKYFNCGDKARSQFNFGLEQAKIWSDKIREKKNEPNK